MIDLLAHQLETAHVPHDGPSVWLFVAGLATIMLIVLWHDFSNSMKQRKDDSY